MSVDDVFLYIHGPHNKDRVSRRGRRRRGAGIHMQGYKSTIDLQIATKITITTYDSSNASDDTKENNGTTAIAKASSSNHIQQMTAT